MTRRAAANGPAGIEAMGHREYVGGLWDEVGRLQLEFLVDQGLRPRHVLVDIACGSLRGGVHLVPYLERGNYLGIELEPVLVERGITEELGDRLFSAKAPEFVISAEFEFARFSKKPQFAIAQSLFTHLVPADILLCLGNLRTWAGGDCRLYATFNLVSTPRANPRSSHTHALFGYTIDEMAAFADATGWRGRYLGDWGHPRNQQMFEYTAARS